MGAGKREVSVVTLDVRLVSPGVSNGFAEAIPLGLVDSLGDNAPESGNGIQHLARHALIIGRRSLGDSGIGV